MTLRFAVGVAIIGVGALLYQLIALLAGVGDPWSLGPGLLVLGLAFATLQTDSRWPAVIGFVASLPLVGVSIIDALVQTSDPELAELLLFGYFGSITTMLAGVAYALYAAGRAVAEPWLPSAD